MSEKPQPIRVLYCSVCSLPAEYCEFGPDFEKCKPWLIRNAPNLYPDLIKGLAKTLTLIPLFFFGIFFKVIICAFCAPEANAKEADRVTEQLQSTGISSDGATPSGMLLLLVLILSFNFFFHLEKV